MVEDRNFFDTKIIGQMFNPSLGLLEIRAADIDDIAVIRIAKEFGARERPDEWDLGFRCNWLSGLRGWRSNRADKSKNLVLVDNCFSGFNGFLGLIAVVDRLEFEFAAADATRAIGEIRRPVAASMRRPLRFVSDSPLGTGGCR